MKLTCPQPTRMQTSGFTMVEIIIVIAIVGILSGIGAVGFIQQIDRSRVNSASSIINAHLLQARQSAIATRETRRVAIYVGQLEDMDELSGPRVDRGSIWIEAKRCEKFDFSEPAYCADASGSLSNTVELTDSVALPDGVTIASVGDVMIGPNGNLTLYIEYNPRGQATQVYFAGDESVAADNLAIATELAIHITKDNEFFETPRGERSYMDTVGNINLNDWSFAEEDNVSNERFKVHTIEIIRLTGKTRTYPYAIFGFWPSDEFTS